MELLGIMDLAVVIQFVMKSECGNCEPETTEKTTKKQLSVVIG